MVQNMDRLIDHYWDSHKFVAKANRFLGTSFGTVRGATQGDPTSPIMFNIVVDAVVRDVLDVVCGPQEAQHSMGWDMGERNMVFYANDGRI